MLDLLEQSTQFQLFFRYYSASVGEEMASRYRVEAVHSFVSYNDVFHCEKSEIAGCYWSWSFLQRVPLQRFEGRLSFGLLFCQSDMFSKGPCPLG